MISCGGIPCVTTKIIKLVGPRMPEPGQTLMIQNIRDRSQEVELTRACLCFVKWTSVTNQMNERKFLGNITFILPLRIKCILRWHSVSHHSIQESFPLSGIKSKDLCEIKIVLKLHKCLLWQFLTYNFRNFLTQGCKALPYEG